MKEGKIMTESFGDKFRNKQQLSSENIDKEKLDEIVQAAKDEVNEYQEQETYLSHDNERLSFMIPELSNTQLAYIAKKLDMHVMQLENNSLDIDCTQKPFLTEYLNVGSKLGLFCVPELIAVFIVFVMGSIFGFNTDNVIVRGIALFVILCGLLSGLYLSFSNNKLVEKAIDNQIKNEILNK